jgi:hypothetical protein
MRVDRSGGNHVPNADRTQTARRSRGNLDGRNEEVHHRASGPQREARADRRRHEVPTRHRDRKRQVIPFWTGEIVLPTQTGHRQNDDKSVQFPADEANENLFTRMPNGETLGEAPHLMSEAAAQEPFSITPDPVPVLDRGRGEDAPPTQNGHRQDNESLQIPADAVLHPASRARRAPRCSTPWARM